MLFVQCYFMVHIFKMFITDLVLNEYCILTYILLYLLLFIIVFGIYQICIVVFFIYSLFFVHSLFYISICLTICLLVSVGVKIFINLNKDLYLLRLNYKHILSINQPFEQFCFYQLIIPEP